MSKDTKKITTTLFLPVSVEIHVSWNDEDEQSEIHRVVRSMIQEGLSPRHISENCDEESLAYIDELTKEAFGLSDG